MSIPVGPAAESLRAAPVPSSRAGGVEGMAALAGGAAGQAQDSTPAAPEALDDAVREINASMADQSIGVRFEVDDDTDRLVVKVVDRASGELIRQIPSEEVLRIAKLLGKVPGVLMSQNA